VIHDRQGVILAENAPRFQVTFLPREAPRGAIERETALGEAGRVLGLPYATLQVYASATGTAQDTPVVVIDKIPYAQAMRFATALPHLPGFRLEVHPIRHYPQSTSVTSLSHVLGYVGRLSPEEYESRADQGYRHTDEIGKTGIERWYEEILRGKLGERMDEVDARGKTSAFVGEHAAENGEDLTLSLDVALQAEAQNALQAELTKAKVTRGAAIAMDPRDGSILALVSLPAFDNNDFAGSVSSTVYQRLTTDPAQPLFARAVSGAYPSGSTVKMVMSAAALAEGIITPETVVLSTGGIRVGQWFFPDWKAGGHGVTNVRRALAWSVNTFYYYIGGGYAGFQGLGVDRISAWMRRFGLGARTGIDLPAEVPGTVPDPAWKLANRKEQWYIGDTYNLSIGQGDLLVTPIQVAMYTAEIANGGKHVVPHLFKDALDKSALAAFTTTTTVGAPTSAYDTVRQGMRDGVISGTSRSLSTLPFTAAGKTGTAQWSSQANTHAWFTSFAPYEQPEIVVTVLLEEGGEGSSVPVPVAKQILAAWDRLKKERNGTF
jgi:penicillin-binding protein 2